MSVITILGWIGFVASMVVLGFFMLVDLSGGELKLPGVEVYNSVSIPEYIIALAVLVVVFAGFILVAGQLKKILQ